MSKRKGCASCAHYENCGAGTRNCQSYVPAAEVNRDADSRNAFRRELLEYKQAWDEYEFCPDNSD